MNGPFIWIIIPAFFSVLFYIFRKNYWLVCLFQTALCFILALLAVLIKYPAGGTPSIFGIEITPSLNFLGRVINLDQSSFRMLLVLNGLLGFWSLSLYIHRIPSLLVPLGIIFNSFLISALAVEPFLYSGLILEIAVLVSVPVMLENNRQENEAVLRYLFFFSIGMVLILLAGWYLAGGEISPVNEEQLIQATLILGLGFIMWLAIFPFHTWIPAVSESLRTVNTFYILITLPIIIFVLLLKYLNGFSWLREYSIIYQALGILGMILCITGSLWAAFQKDLHRTVGYLFLFSIGLMLSSAGLNSILGFYLSTYFIYPRIINFFILAWTIVLLERELQSMNLKTMKSLFYTKPITASAFIVSVFSIAAMPFTPTFPPTFSLLELMSQKFPSGLWVLLFSIAILSFTFFRLLLIFLTQSDYYIDSNPEDIREKLFFGVLIIILIFSGIFPNFFFSASESIVSGYDFLVQ